MKLTVPEHILSLNPYEPGKPLEEVEREYGIKDSIKLASNENPLGPSPMALKAIQASIVNLNRYPDGSGHALLSKLAQKLNLPGENIVLGNGSDEIMALLALALLQIGDHVIIPTPTFLLYENVVRSMGATPIYVPLHDLSIDLDAVKKNITPACRMIFLCNPNNPTGTVFSRADLAHFLDSVPSTVVVVVDEAYIEFARDPNCAKSLEVVAPHCEVVTLRTFSKAYGLAGLRIGYGVMSQALAEVMNRVRLPFNINTLALVGAAAALDDDDFLRSTINLVHAGLDFMYQSLDRLGVRYFPTQANFLLIDVAKDAQAVFQHMLADGVIVRSMKAYGFPTYIRVNVGLESENIRFIKTLEKVLGQ
ncbi:MAG: histidinol-phosphate transaminase [Desulfobacterales bacterium]